MLLLNALQSNSKNAGGKRPSVSTSTVADTELYRYFAPIECRSAKDLNRICFCTRLDDASASITGVPRHFWHILLDIQDIAGIF